MVKDYYAVLGLDRDATDDEIKTTYRNAIKECHPDIAGNDPELVARFQVLTEAYKILVDPYRRKLHDQELPIKSYPLRRPTPAKVWKEVTEVIIMRSDKIGPFQRAVQDAVGVTLEENTFVVGFPHDNFQPASYLDLPANRYAVINALNLVMGREIEFRYIRGTALEDWETVKANEARVAAKAQEAAQPAAAPSVQTSNIWDELIIRMHRSFNETPQRQLPQFRAKFFPAALRWINDVDERARLLDSTESTERSLAKAIDRLANLVDFPSTLVALELERLKRSYE